MERENAGAAMDQPTEEEEPAGVSGTKQYTTKEDGSDEKVWLNGRRHLVKNVEARKSN